MNPKKVLALIRFKLKIVAKASFRIQSLYKITEFFKAIYDPFREK